MQSEIMSRITERRSRVLLCASGLSRALQGVGAAIQLSAALAVLGHEFRGMERVRAFGFWGAVLGVAVTAGPIIGGLATSYLSWRRAFLVNIWAWHCSQLRETSKKLDLGHRQLRHMRRLVR
jgi:hypothetical protein